MKNFALHIPEGVKDYIGDEAALKDHIQNTIKKIFRTNSYNLIETPSFEYLDVFALGEENFQQPSLYHLVNRQGELMALRSDMTRSIARVIGTQKGENPFPQRFSYLANSFRYPQRYQGKLHEFTQAGVELIGHNSLDADAEVIKVAINCLHEIGVTDLTVHIGSAPFLTYLLEDLGVGDLEATKVFEAIEAKDAVWLKSILKEVQIESMYIELLLELIQCSGKIEILRPLKGRIPSARVRQVIEGMEQLYERLEDYGVNECITFDFGIMSYGKYYTGMMFQVYTPGIGSALVEGGRYDQLLCQFGKDLPAVGFGMPIHLIMQRLLQQRGLDERQPKKTLVVCTNITRKVCQEISDHLRKQDLIIESYLSDDIESAITYGKQVGIGGILHFKYGDKIDVYNLEQGTTHETSIKEL